ncbi:hypothetical protein CcarbDRAFT_0770 [Clostridium carboxidivorans P7]|uniref:Uncharacterized protein n=1 Tax=Clostridium carboxidivorans P7 TaxID=536227 RepID=C6PPQ3_9CLOT|nr:hypothetical protein [Clostridium carboxidivorans]EET88783.1 hypothetical protein CcarbDRAFT_0770 [Clostridium carboxidivorans P7]
MFFKIANEYIGEHNQLIVDKKKEKENIIKVKNTNFEDLIKVGNEIIKVQIDVLEKNYCLFNDLKNETEEFLKKHLKLQRKIQINIQYKIFLRKSSCYLNLIY